jgi:GT2 family glycosyltransferase
MYFLEQSLTSVLKATTAIDAEVFVVDNNSPDESVEMVKNKFPSVKIIANKNNVGFSKANNQAIEQSKGEYVLLLNPDTVVEEDTFEKCIAFMDAHPDAGGLGVKMIDGNGIFLPESKRGLPTPSVSFYKIFGLSKIFPKSKQFAKYHLGHLKEDDVNEIEVLSGAYMWMRKSVLDKIGYLDEAFFMYGEDIDLSYRIIQAGYKNYYFPEAKIIHYKGESTKKGNINYVFVFYNAMIIFSKKHFAKKAKAFSFFINIAIYMRAFMAILFRFFSRTKLVFIDALLIFLGLGILNYMKPYVGFPNQISLTSNIQLLNVLSVLFSVILGIAIVKGYKKPISINKTLLGLCLGSILFFTINLTFPMPRAFSYKYIGSIVAILFILIPISRFVLHYFNQLTLKKIINKTTIIAGNPIFKDKLKNLLKETQSTATVLALKENNTISKDTPADYIGKLYQLPDLIEIYNANEVIFSSNDISYKDMITEMSLSKNKMVDYKISLNDNLIIGSHSIEKI